MVLKEQSNKPRSTKFRMVHGRNEAVNIFGDEAEDESEIGLKRKWEAARAELACARAGAEAG